MNNPFSSDQESTKLIKKGPLEVRDELDELEKVALEALNY